MRYDDFRQKMHEYPFFHSNIFPHLDENVALLRNQVHGWVERGLIIMLKRGMYTLRDVDRTAKFSNYFLANALYFPSYISLESALSYYNVIPEQVVVTTSITSKKTQTFSNDYGKFVYHSMKSNLFGDFVVKKDQYGNKFFIATKERALVDFLYFRTRGMTKFDITIFDESYRLQNLEDVNKQQIQSIAEKFGQKKLLLVIKMLIDYLEEQYGA